MVELGEKGDMDKIFLRIPNVSWLTEYQMRTIINKCHELRAASLCRVAREHVSERRSCGGRDTKSSHFLSLHLAPSSRFVCDFSQRSCLQAFKVVMFVRDGCIVIIMARSMPSKPTPPKAFDITFGSRHLSKSRQSCSNSRL